MSKPSFKYTLGTVVKDKVSGYEGVLIGRTEWFYGCIRYVAQAQALHEGVPVEACAFDEDSLEVVGEIAPDKDPNFLYNLGSRVEDKVTTAVGILQSRTQWLYSVNRYNVQPTLLKDGNPVKPVGVEEPAIKLLDAAEPHEVRRTGGPGDLPASRAEAL